MSARASHTPDPDGGCRYCGPLPDGEDMSSTCPRPTVVLNDRCPDCGNPWRCAGPLILPGAPWVFCCAAEIARHRARLAANPAGVRYVRPVTVEATP